MFLTFSNKEEFYPIRYFIALVSSTISIIVFITIPFLQYISTADGVPMFIMPLYIIFFRNEFQFVLRIIISIMVEEKKKNYKNKNILEMKINKC